MLRIGWLELPENITEDNWQISGGMSYRRHLYDILSPKYELESMRIGGGILSRSIIKNLYRSLTLNKRKDIWIREINSTILPIRNTVGANVLLFHHLGGSIPTGWHWLNKILESSFFWNLKRIDVIVTVSQYWKEYFLKKGYSNVRIIYNPFDAEKFYFAAEEVDQFKERYQLLGKPIVYIGNCQKWKGVIESHEALKDLDAHIITSGKKTVDLPCRNLNLDYQDYLRLLRASSVVVTMSKFHEGWCRTAHEAMLCKTPVVGSGLGGMRELLIGGGQIVSGFDNLKNNVEFLIEHRDIGEDGFHFAKQFTIEKFEREWIKLISDLAGNRQSSDYIG
ncbi:glycosyltransferase family 4 protein [Chloroflexota bacterium]